MADILAPFNSLGLLPPGDYRLTLEDLADSHLVTGCPSPTWDESWRLQLVKNLAVLVDELWQVGITKIFIDGSFTEDKDHPNDIDGYFECELGALASGQLQRDLNLLNEFKVWTWDPTTRREYRGYPKKQLPMWVRYRVELYPHITDAPWQQQTGIKDQFGHDLEFPSAFRQSRAGVERGIVKIEPGGSQHASD